MIFDLNKKMTKETKRVDFKKKKPVLTWVFGCLGILILITSLFLNGLLGLFLLTSFAEKGSGRIKFNQETLQGDPDSENVIAVVPINGVIEHRSGGTTTSRFFAEDVINQFKNASQDKRVKALLLKVNSPGGTISASDDIYHELLHFKESGKPVLAYFGETAASGAYYVSLPANEIIAEPSSMVGSIGAIINYYNVEELMKKIGVKEEVFKSGGLKDIFSYSRPITEEEKKIINDLVADSKEQFTSKVLKHRSINNADLETIFDSRVFTSKQALKLGLIDEIGYFDDAISKSAVKANIKDYAVIEYEQKFNFLDYLGEFRSQINGGNIFTEIKTGIFNNQPRLMYLWK